MVCSAGGGEGAHVGGERFGNDDGLGAEADRDVCIGGGHDIHGQYSNVAERLRVEEHEAPGDSVDELDAGIA